MRTDTCFYLFSFLSFKLYNLLCWKNAVSKKLPFFHDYILIADDDDLNKVSRFDSVFLEVPIDFFAFQQLNP